MIKINNAVLKNFATLIGKDLCKVLSFNKVAGREAFDIT